MPDEIDTGSFCEVHSLFRADIPTCEKAVETRRKSMKEQFIAEIKFDAQGLVPAVVQDTRGTVLMVAWMNRTAIEKTLDTGMMHYYSRSRRSLWRKGESSGHTQQVKSIAIDCDGDCLLFSVVQKGGACHTGYHSCFYRIWKNGRWVPAARRCFDPERVYRR